MALQEVQQPFKSGVLVVFGDLGIFKGYFGQLSYRLLESFKLVHWYSAKF